MAAITLSVIAIATSILVYYNMRSQVNSITQKANAQTKDVYLSTVYDADADTKRLLGIPVDEYTQKFIIVNQGDTVNVHFFSAEKPGSTAIHSFTIDAPYNIHAIVKQDESKTITFVADIPGTFEYRCLYHPDTMKGELVVLP